MSIPMEHVLLKGTALRHQMKKAEKKFKELFVEPVREFLRKQPDNATEVLGITRTVLRINKPKPEVNEKAVLEELRNQVSTGAFSAQELAQMILDGSLDVGDPNLLVEKVAVKLGVDPTIFTHVIAKKKEDSVQWNVIDKKKGIDKLTNGFKKLHDLEGSVESSLKRSLDADIIAKLQQ